MSRRMYTMVTGCGHIDGVLVVISRTWLDFGNHLFMSLVVTFDPLTLL